MTTLTMDFKEEYEAERTRWLRKRFLYYSGVMASFTAVLLLIDILGMGSVGDNSQGTDTSFYQAIQHAINTIIFVLAFFHALKKVLKREQLLHLVYWLIVISGSVAIITTHALAYLQLQNVDPDLIILSIRIGTAFAVFLAHITASLFIPWTAKESIRPLGPLLIVFAAITLLVAGGGLWGRLLTVGLSPLVGLPGYFICWLRHSRFRQQFHYRMLRGRYGELQRELVDARRVHESLFPEPIEKGPVRFHYTYEPMRQIGGDYLYACQTPASDGNAATVNLILLDVTGHGVAAALTVNRIYGELERLFAEQPDISPGEIIFALNRYVNLTLAKHSVYATALSLRIISDKDFVEWSSAGHPPAFLRTAAGLIDRLESSAPLLGVFKDNEFEAEQKSIRFGSGDTLIAYTDGATDAANEAGERIRIDGIQRILANTRPKPDDQGRWVAAILQEINEYRFGAAIDDTLLVEIWRPVDL